jgi:hypothetical protein
LPIADCQLPIEREAGGRAFVFSIGNWQSAIGIHSFT